jgi:hypothetical protein
MDFFLPVAIDLERAALTTGCLQLAGGSGLALSCVQISTYCSRCGVSVRPYNSTL